MPENHLSKKAKQYLKEGRHAIAEKLEATFAEYKKGTDEKDFKKVIKKASKVLSAGITLPTTANSKHAEKKEPSKKTVSKKASKAIKPKAVQKKAARKAVAKKEAE